MASDSNHPPESRLYQQISPSISVDSLQQSCDNDDCKANVSVAAQSDPPPYSHQRYERVQHGESEEIPQIAPPTIWQQCGRIFTYGWVAETLACLLACLSLVSIIAILGTYQGKPLPEWPMGITINALVSVFSVLLKAGVSLPLVEGISHLKWLWFTGGTRRRLVDLEEFDSASRGPWGSLVFLFRVEADALSVLAKASALLLILSLAIDPFTQQVVEYVPCSRPSSAPAGIARTVWTKSNQTLTMARAISDGLLQNPQSPDYSCPTGNCTFPDFSTLGVCHKCEDVTSSIILTNSTQFERAAFLLPPEAGVGQEELALRDWATISTRNHGLHSTGIVHYEVLSVEDPILTKIPHGVRCVIDLCIRAFRAEVENHVLSEHELWRVDDALFWYHSQTESINSGKPYNEEDYRYTIAGDYNLTEQGNDVDGRTNPSACAGSSEPVPGQIKMSRRLPQPSPVEAGELVSRWFPSSCLYWLNHHALYYLRNELEAQMDKQTYHWDSPIEDVAQSLMPRMMWEDCGMVADVSCVDAVMQNLTYSVTSLIRRIGGREGNSSGEYARGIAYEMVTCANVRWEWLSFSMVLVLLTTLWLTLLVLQSPRGNTRRQGWKSSSLAVLFAGLEDRLLPSGLGDGRESLFDMTRHEMEQVASKIDARLVRADDGKAKFM